MKKSLYFVTIGILPVVVYYYREKNLVDFAAFIIDAILSKTNRLYNPN